MTSIQGIINNALVCAACLRLDEGVLYCPNHRVLVLLSGEGVINSQVRFSQAPPPAGTGNAYQFRGQIAVDVGQTWIEVGRIEFVR